MNNICIITLDSLRYDAAIQASTPNMDKYFTFEKSYTHATSTLPFHVNLFHFGTVPYQYEGRYDYRKFRMFRVGQGFDRINEGFYKVPASSSLVKGFETIGYSTFGIGGVRVFDRRRKTTAVFWDQYFKEFYWNPQFVEGNISAFERQLEFLSKFSIKEREPLFFYINVPSTHWPYRQNQSYDGQVQALEYVDEHIEKLFKMLPTPCHYIIFADHGEAFPEKDGKDFVGHNFYHPSVMEVPMIDFILDYE